ncbi:nuclear RNA export factor 2-like [Molossus nigricans]
MLALDVLQDSDGGSSPQGKKEGWNSFRGNIGKRTHHYQHGGYELQPSYPHKDNGYMGMRGVQKYQARHTPYIIQCNKRQMKLHNEGCVGITVWRGRKPLQRKTENPQDEITRRWFKITIPYGRKYDKTWLIDSIQSRCSIPFIPVEFHYAQNRAQFFVQDASAASALKDVSYKIYDEENKKIPIFVSTSVPYSVQDKLKPEEMEQLKLTMNKRYDVSHKALDLQSLRYDPGFAHLHINIILNRRSCMAATLQIIEKNFPELLSLNLHNNRLYQLDGLSDIIQMAPTIKILNLSKNELKSTWELDKIKGLKLEELWLEDNPLCHTFPDQSMYIRYYLIYDSGDRQRLLGAYHDEACFSLTIPFIWDNPAISSLFEYFKDNINMEILKDPSACGMEKIGPGKKLSEGPFFSSIFIVNDELFVRDATPSEIQKSFSIPVPTLSQEQQEMVQVFSTQSGMKPQWSQKCLQDNEWNYTRAAQVFTMLKIEGKIPEEAFKQIP